ncbi:hypothetical protein MKX01_009003, partial [Papaver californicum]
MATQTILVAATSTTSSKFLLSSSFSNPNPLSFSSINFPTSKRSLLKSLTIVSALKKAVAVLKGTSIAQGVHEFGDTTNECISAGVAEATILDSQLMAICLVGTKIINGFSHCH